MEFSFTAEQDQFRDILGRFLRDKSPASAVRSVMETDQGYDTDVWRRCCVDLGLAGIHLPEDCGGTGYGPVELAIVMEEQGRALLCAPFLASPVMAGYAIMHTGTDDQQQVLLPSIADGSTLATLAITEQSGLWHDDDVQLQATRSGDGYVLGGTKRFVVDGQNADLLVVAGRTGEGVSLFTVDASSEGVTCKPMDVLDKTRKLAEIDFASAPAQLLGTGNPVDLQAIFNAVLVAFAHEMVGGAQAMLDSAVEYAGLRVQFGREIGSFQGLKHRFSDLMVDVELAKAAAYQAAQHLADGADATAFASMAKARASEVFRHAAHECIQFHGGIGFTWENDTHLWFKRAKSSEVFLGTPNDHRERMLQAMGI
jgi:alkylation response protein AidB-like acyl-CoA dehydrogenase